MPELVAATGYALPGGFALFQVRSRIPNPASHFLLTIYHPYLSVWKRDLLTRSKCKLHAIGGARGLWSLPVHMAV
jgi:hypothetical protein